MIEIQAPLPFNEAPRPWVFLAGSIEMGTAENWQTLACQRLATGTGTLLNPRRDDWDASWEQKESNPQFHEQVTWELSALEGSDLALMYFAPGTKSPITLLELGLFARSNPKPRLVVCCPDGFWRKGNVDIVCSRYGVDRVASLDELIDRAL